MAKAALTNVSCDFSWIISSPDLLQNILFENLTPDYLGLFRFIFFFVMLNWMEDKDALTKVCVWITQYLNIIILLHCFNSYRATLKIYCAQDDIFILRPSQRTIPRKWNLHIDSKESVYRGINNSSYFTCST